MAKGCSDVWQQTRALMFNSSCYAILFCVVLIVGYLCSFNERLLFMFTVLPGNVLPPNYWIWTCATHSIIEVHWWIVVWDIVSIFVQSKLLGPLWGRAETVKFYVLVTTIVALLTILSYVCIYLITQNSDYLFDDYVSGLAGYLAGVSVSVKQIMPDHVVVNMWSYKLRNNDLPVLLLLLAVFFRVIGIVEAPFPLMFLWGLWVSWMYLRFYQKHDNGSRGDSAEHFSLASFFPVCFRPLIMPVTDVLSSLFVKLKLCDLPQRKSNVNRSTTITINLPGCETHESDDKRLSKTISKPDQNSLDKKDEIQPKQTSQNVK